MQLFLQLTSIISALLSRNFRNEQVNRLYPVCLFFLIIGKNNNLAIFTTYLMLHFCVLIMLTVNWCYVIFCGATGWLPAESLGIKQTFLFKFLIEKNIDLLKSSKKINQALHQKKSVTKSNSNIFATNSAKKETLESKCPFWWDIVWSQILFVQKDKSTHFPPGFTP